MRVSDILKVKGNTLFTVTPDTALNEAVNTMAEHDIGSLVVMEYGDLVGMLTFREIILTLRANGGSVGTTGRASIRRLSRRGRQLGAARARWKPCRGPPATFGMAAVTNVRRRRTVWNYRFLHVLSE